MLLLNFIDKYPLITLLFLVGVGLLIGLLFYQAEKQLKKVFDTKK